MRRLNLDIENIKVEFVKPMEEKLQKLMEEFNKKRKQDQKSKSVTPLEITAITQGTTNTSISKDDMKEFEDKLEKFKEYWLGESEKFVKHNLLEILTGWLL